MDPTYQRARHLVLLAEHLEALQRRDIKKLLVAMPPRHGKTRMSSQMFPAFWLGKEPTDQVVLASYGATLAESNSRAARRIVSSPDYPFETQVSSESSAVDHWETTAGGVVTAVGREGALTGSGAHLLAVDDLIKDREEADSPAIRESAWQWYGEVAKSRRAPNAVELFIGTIWGEDDPICRLLNTAGAKKWTTLILPAIAEENDEPDPLGRTPGEVLWPRFPIEYFEDMRQTMSPRSFSAIYQQHPVPFSGNVFKREWFKHRYERLPVKTEGVSIRTIAAVDSALGMSSTADYTVIVTLMLANNLIYVAHIRRERAQFTDLPGIVSNEHARWNPSMIYIEQVAAHSGAALVQELHRHTSLPIKGVKPQGNKIARAELVTPMLESGRVLFPQSAPWLDDFIEELCTFPTGKHDDQVDSFTLGLSQLMQKRFSYVGVLGGDELADYPDKYDPNRAYPARLFGTTGGIW
jgi:predicted phage terminase large subunit-like protein